MLVTPTLNLTLTPTLTLTLTLTKARTPLLNLPHVSSIAVALVATNAGSFPGAPPAAADGMRASRQVFYAYYDPRAPVIELSSPLSGPCGVGSAHVLSTFPGDCELIEVTPMSELMLSVHGSNFAPTPMLTCIYRSYYDEQKYFDTDLGYGDEHR